MKELVKQFQESMSRISDDEFLKVWDELVGQGEIGDEDSPSPSSAAAIEGKPL